MHEYIDSSFSDIRDSLTEATRVSTHMLEEHNRPVDVMVLTPRHKAVPPGGERPPVTPRGSVTSRRAFRYKEIVPLPLKSGQRSHVSGRRFFVRELEQTSALSKLSIYSDLIMSAKGVAGMILELSERNRARNESRVHRDSAWVV